MLSVADAGLSSLGNLVISIAGARSLDLDDFGVLASLLVIAILAVGVSKVGLVDAFTLRYSAAEHATRRETGRRVLGSAVLVGSAAAVVVVGVGVVVGPQLLIGYPIAVLGLTFPLLIAQDSLRWIAYVENDLGSALLNTGTWTAGTVVGAGLLLVHDASSTTALLAVWGGSAGVAVLVTVVRTRLVPCFHGVTKWLREARYSGTRIALDYVLTQAIGAGGGLLIAMVAGAAAYGTLRVAQLPLAFVQVAITGTVALLQPTMVVEVACRRHKRARRLSALAASGMIGVLVVVTGVAYLAPADVMTTVFGFNWPAARELVPLVSLGLVGAALSASYGPFLRAVGGLNYEVLVKTLTAPGILVVIVLASAWSAAAGGAVAQAAGALILAAFTIARAFRSDSVIEFAPAGQR